tara:strand:+ start:1116 stop:1694 length:579 start_codon:yes stop_codon:yes gene_type:complete
MTTKRATREDAEKAVRTLLSFIGEDPDREGLIDTPKRVVKAYGEWFAGYSEDPHKILSTTFGEVGGYDEIIAMRNIRLESHCEHHMVPIVGHVHVGYLPGERVVGLSKLARIVNSYGKRLQVQERLTAEIADAIEECLKPRGVAVIVSASHLCVSTRGVHKPGSAMVTSAMRGVFRNDSTARSEILTLLQSD